MATVGTPSEDAVPAPAIMAPVEEVGAETRLVIADISQDGAWVSASKGRTRRLVAWR